MLDNWLKPLSSDVLEFYKKGKDNTLGKHLYLNNKNASQVDQKVALIFSCEQSDVIRRAFCKLEFKNTAVSVIDLGDLRNKDFNFPIPLLKELIEGNCIPIILSDAIEYSLAISKTMDSIFKEFKVSAATDDVSKFVFMEDMLMLENLKSFCALGYQKHLCNPHYLKIPRWNNHSCLSLGQIRDDFTNLEPAVRNINTFSFDTSCLRHSDFPSENNNPFGLFAEESCQLFNYLGMADEIKAIHLFGPGKTDLPSNANLIVGLIWYFLEGLSNKKNDVDNQKDLIQYLVPLNEDSEALSFWKSPVSNRWWVEVPNNINEKKDFIPCTENEYRLACKEIISDRLFKIFYSS